MPGKRLRECETAGRTRLTPARSFRDVRSPGTLTCAGCPAGGSHALAGGAGPVPLARRVPRPERGSSSLKVSGGEAATFWSWRPRGGGGGLGLAGAAPGTVALTVQQQVVAGVEDPVQDGLADDRVGEQRVPVGRAAVGGQDQRPAGAADPLGEQLIQVVGWAAVNSRIAKSSQ